MANSFSRIQVAGFLLSFFMIGVVQALYGPLLGSFMGSMHISYAQAGSLLGVHFIGALLGVLAFRPAERHGFNPRLLLRISLSCMILGSAGVACAPNFFTLLIADFICGLGFGGIDYGLNYIFSSVFPARRATAMLNLLNGCFGVGAIAGPGLALLAGYSVVGAFLLFSAGCAVCFALLLSLPAIHLVQGGDRPDTDLRHTLVSVRSIRGIAIVALFLILYIFHVGAETGIGGWGQSYLEWRSYSSESATNFVMAFWLAMTVSRFLVIPLAKRFSGQLIVGVCLAGMTISLLAPLLHAYDGVAFVAAGLFIGPIFPTCIPWLKASLEASSGVLSVVIALSMLGGVVFPPLIGALIANWGFLSIAVVVFVLTLTMFVSYFALLRTTRVATR